MVGKNLINHNNAKEYSISGPSSKEINLLDKSKILDWLAKNPTDLIIHCAGLVGGIQANINNQSGFLFNNIQMGINLIDAAYKSGIRNFINLGSSCIYPKNISNEIDESMLLSGKLEETNEGYAIAKISVAKYCQFLSEKGFNYKTIIPCNIYGKYDDFSETGSHMIPGVIARMHKAKINNDNYIEIWGDGKARREFMYAEDLADAIWFCVKNIKEIPEFINVGIGEDFSIKDYYQTISQIVGFKGEFKFNRTKPVGMKRKLISSKIINQLGWMPKFSLNKGISCTYNYYTKEIQN